MRRFYRSLKKRVENEITSVDSIQLLAKDSKINIFNPDPIDEISIIGKKHSGNIMEPIDEIQIIGKEIITNIYEPIDEIEIEGKKRVDNIYEPIDEISIIGMDLDIEKINKKEDNNICTTAIELEISSKENKKEEKIEKNKKYNTILKLIDNDSSIKEIDKENIDNNIVLNMNESDNKKLQDINKLKSQLEKEKKKLKKLFTKILELENELDGNII